MLNSPQFMQQMSSLMNNPAIVDQIIASNPQLAAMGPRVREVFQDEGFRQMLYVLSFPSVITFYHPLYRSNPETLQQMLRMASAFGGPSPSGNSGFVGSPFGTSQSAFPAPGTPNANPANPSSTTPTATNTSTTAPYLGSPNPFGFNPALMQQMLAASQGATAAGGWPPAFGIPSVPTNTRPPEERFQVQLQVTLFIFFSFDSSSHFTNPFSNFSCTATPGYGIH